MHRVRTRRSPAGDSGAARDGQGRLSISAAGRRGRRARSRASTQPELPGPGHAGQQRTGLALDHPSTSRVPGGRRHGRSRRLDPGMGQPRSRASTVSRVHLDDRSARRHSTAVPPRPICTELARRPPTGCESPPRLRPRPASAPRQERARPSRAGPTSRRRTREPGPNEPRRQQDPGPATVRRVTDSRVPVAIAAPRLARLPGRGAPGRVAEAGLGRRDPRESVHVLPSWRRAARVRPLFTLMRPYDAHLGLEADAGRLRSDLLARALDQGEHVGGAGVPSPLTMKFAWVDPRSRARPARCALHARGLDQARPQNRLPGS